MVPLGEDLPKGQLGPLCIHYRTVSKKKKKKGHMVYKTLACILWIEKGLEQNC